VDNQLTKYATYRLFKNKKTGETKQVLLTEELEKLASEEWEELDAEPQD
jgi:hypothetical protein